MGKKVFTGNNNNWWRHLWSGSGAKICVRAFFETILSKVSSCQKEIYSENLNDTLFFWLLSAALIEFGVDVSVLPTFLNFFCILCRVNINFKEWRSVLSRERFCVSSIYQLNIWVVNVWVFTVAFFLVKSLFLFCMFQSIPYFL